MQTEKQKRSRTARSVLGLMIVGAYISAGQTFQTLVNFDGSNGANPGYMTMIQGADGGLYGTTQNGGTNGLGTVFRLNQAGTFTLVHSFSGSDGSYPEAGLLLGTDGFLYGTTGGGTVFRMTPKGALLTLADDVGGEPTGPLVQSAGSLYGLTFFGGAGAGSFYEVTPGSGVSTVYDFPADGSGGQNPNNGLVQDATGNFYGTTEYGATNGCGVIFKITPAGVPTISHYFTRSSNPPDGCNPLGTLVLANDGKFYGVTPGGGTYGYGTVFSIDAAGNFTTIYSFMGGVDGAEPRSGSLALANDGNLYGTTSLSGDHNCGTIFKISLAGNLTPLYQFNPANPANVDGCDSEGGLLQATNGVVYGSTWRGGANSLGTIFSLNVGLPPLVKTVPAMGRVGTSVMILGTNLAEATGVTFNGVPASFTVASRFLINTAVPTGAPSGVVKVTVPAGTLRTVVRFIVTP